MKKTIKIARSIVVILILIYTLFIVEESIRLSNNSLAVPLIVFEESYSDDDNNVIYESIGFTLTTKFANFSGSTDMVYPIAQEFWLFDKFLIWGWIS